MSRENKRHTQDVGKKRGQPRDLPAQIPLQDSPAPPTVEKARAARRPARGNCASEPPLRLQPWKKGGKPRDLPAKISLQGLGFFALKCFVCTESSRVKKSDVIRFGDVFTLE